VGRNTQRAWTAGEAGSGKTNLRGGDGGGRGSRARSGRGARWWWWWREDEEEEGLAMAGAAGGGTPRGLPLRLASLLARCWQQSESASEL